MSERVAALIDSRLFGEPRAIVFSSVGDWRVFGERIVFASRPHTRHRVDVTAQDVEVERT